MPRQGLRVRVDTLSPALMDYIATFTARASGVLKD
jgi:hypothetical protein